MGSNAWASDMDCCHVAGGPEGAQACRDKAPGEHPPDWLRRHAIDVATIRPMTLYRHAPTDRALGATERMAARFQSFMLARIARDACRRQAGCSRLTPP